MIEGIVQNEREEVIADFLINSGYEPFNVLPLCCVLSGSTAYGLAGPDSDRDYIGIHLMDTWDCLEHPDFQPRVQVLRQKFTNELEMVPTGEKGGAISLDSFEIWKFISLYLKGSPVSYELLYLPTIHCVPEAASLFDLMRRGVTNRIGKAARGIAMHEWAKKKSDRKRAIMAYYRLAQAVFFLREGEFEWEVGNLLEYMKPSGIIEVGKVTIEEYMNPELRSSPLVKIEEIGIEIHRLIDEVDKAGVTTLLPDQVPKEILETILQRVKKTRSSMI